MKEREMPSYIRMPFPLTPLASLFSALASIRFDLDVALLLLMKVRFALLPDTVTQVAVKASSWLRPSTASSSPCTAIAVARLMTTGCSTHGRQARHPRSRSFFAAGEPEMQHQRGGHISERQVLMNERSRSPAAGQRAPSRAIEPA
ncbi:uncharacterized protein [Triticum aestivum]|uniref:uncharacterized protein n=1 Tax=Triticum aestivum TaxID=4565 RepID=UPI001D013FA9|nr:uncharacterized protein LOC123169366 [Triticum aestivum]XP_044443138.1 uncharacterized protein LOC123169366 [Triticum aestivum]